jgi:hypothetical protein
LPYLSPLPSGEVRVRAGFAAKMLAKKTIRIDRVEEILKEI